MSELKYKYLTHEQMGKLVDDFLAGDYVFSDFYDLAVFSSACSSKQLDISSRVLEIMRLEIAMMTEEQRNKPHRPDAGNCSD